MSEESPQSGSDTLGSDGHFHVRCDAGAENRFSLNAGTLCVTVGQPVVRNGVAHMWDSVSIHADQDGEGNWVVQVYVFHPDWDEPLRIARICSWPTDVGCLATLGCNWDHASANLEQREVRRGGA